MSPGHTTTDKNGARASSPPLASKDARAPFLGQIAPQLFTQIGKSRNRRTAVSL